MTVETTETVPEALAKGSFALYKTPKGGLHLALRVEGEDEVRHVEVPAFLLKGAGGGMLAKLLGANNG